MTAQQHADRLLIVYQANRHLPPVARALAIDSAILAAANSNCAPGEALFKAQQSAVSREMGVK